MERANDGGRTTVTAPLLIRADASSEVGAGHVMRSLALAQAWRARYGVAVAFATASCPPRLEDRLKAEGMRTLAISAAPATAEDAAQTSAAAAELGARWVVLDGYAFNDAFEEVVSAGGAQLLSWDDDKHADHTHSRILLNQNPHAAVGDYPSAAAAGVCLLLGPRYLCLREEIRRVAVRCRDVAAQVQRVLVTTGGGDPSRAGAPLLDALTAAQIVDPDRVVVLIGGAADGAEHWASDVRARGHQAIVDAPNPAELMLEADLAISTAGSTTWELALMGVPAAVVPTAPNQRPIADAVQARGVARSLGDLAVFETGAAAQLLKVLADDLQARRQMSARGRALVDGFGVHRVIDAMERPDVLVRPAGWDDAQLLLDWANDPTTRAMSFSTGSIAWEDHAAWLRRRLDDSTCHLFIGVDGAGTPMGQVRVDVDGGVGEISVSVSRDYRGGGRGRALIHAGAREAFRVSSATHITALIKPDNQASIRAFEAVGFVPVGETTRNGGRALRFELSREGERT